MTTMNRFSAVLLAVFMANQVAAGQAVVPDGVSPPVRAAVGGLLGLKSGDDVPDFPIAELPAMGPQAIAAWVLGIITTPASRSDWIGLASIAI